MKRNLLSFVFVFAILLIAGFSCVQAADGDLSLRHIRNATTKLTSGDTTFLIDPMFAEVGAYDGFPNTYRSWLKNPLIPLPMPVKEILDGVDAVVLTHTHLDHWDKSAAKALPKDIPFYMQNEADAKLVRDDGFTNVRIMKPEDEFGGVKMERTATQHGTDVMYADPEVGKLLGDVMGVVFTTPGGRKAWLVADTIWFDGVDKALEKHNPDVIIMNSGGAALTQEKFKSDPEIIMDKKDVLRMTQKAPNAKVVAVHMDAINHMTVDRKDLSEYVNEQGIRDKVYIPYDGEQIKF